MHCLARRSRLHVVIRFKGSIPEREKPVVDSTSSSSSFTPAPRHFGDPLLLSSFAADALGTTQATNEFENAVSDAPLLEGGGPRGAPAEVRGSGPRDERRGERVARTEAGALRQRLVGPQFPLMTSRKGCAVPLVDGGGLCSPGRWPIKQRILSNTRIVTQSREILWDGFLRCVPSFDRGCPRRELMRVACGHREASPLQRRRYCARGRNCGRCSSRVDCRMGSRRRATNVRLLSFASSGTLQKRRRTTEAHVKIAVQSLICWRDVFL